MRKSKQAVLVIASLIFLMLGVMFSQLGPVLAELASRTSTTLAQVGALFTALYIGSLLTQSVAGPISDRIGERPPLLVGLTLAALGVTGMVSSRSLLALLPCAFVTGLGYGFITVCTNLLVARVFVQRSVAALNLANVFYGVGAVIGPALAGLSTGRLDTGLPALLLGVALLVVMVPAVYFSPAGGRRPRQAASAQAPAVESFSGPTRAPRRIPALYRSPLLWTLSVVLALYVGLEAALGGWTTTYLQATAGMRLESAALVVSAYWLALTLGRVVNSWLGTRLTADQVLLLSLGGAMAGGCILALGTGSLVLTVAGVLVVGFSFGAVFPTGLAIVTGTFAPDAGKAASVAQATGSVGGMTIPWLIGLILVRTGPRASMVSIAVGILAMLLCYLWARTLAARHAAGSGYAVEPAPETR
jgi:fucose permease